MNKMLKGFLVGGSIYGVIELGYRFGEGYMLGVLAKVDLSGKECIEILKEDKNFASRFIACVAEWKKNQ